MKRVKGVLIILSLVAWPILLTLNKWGQMLWLAGIAALAVIARSFGPAGGRPKAQATSTHQEANHAMFD